MKYNAVYLKEEAVSGIIRYVWMKDGPIGHLFAKTGVYFQMFGILKFK